MARILVFSDVHANIEALDAVFNHARTQPRPDQVWCLGDLVGYGPDPGLCIDRIKQGFDGITITCVRGNHDEAVINLKNNPQTTEKSDIGTSIRESWSWTARQLTSEQLKYLDDLKKSHEISDLPQSVRLVHAAPPDNMETYLETVRNVEATLSTFHERICCFGHTHLPCYFEHDRSSAQVKPRLLRPKQGSKTLHGDQILLNPGSVGQPRWGILSDGEIEVRSVVPNSTPPPPYPRKLEGLPKATYCWLDLEDDRITVTFHEVEYPVQKTINKLKKLKASKALDVPDRWLDRLQTGLR